MKVSVPAHTSLHRPAINLVCTRCTNGDREALQRWYADHVQLLFTTPQLQQAQLYTCQTLMGPAPEYLCVYDFADLVAFAAFEASEEKAQAGLLTNSAAGRDSIEIVQRTQYERMASRCYGQAGAARYVAACYSGSLTCELAQLRALCDAAEQVRPFVRSLCSVQLFTSAAGLFVLLGLEAEVDTAVALQTWQTALQNQAVYGYNPPSLQLQWAVEAKPLTAWLR